MVKKDPLLGEENAQPTPGTTPVSTPVPTPPIDTIGKPTTSKQPASSEVQNRDIIAETKKKLDAQEHINFIIPVVDGELPGAYETVQINGYKLTIQKGIMVSIPKDVANLLAEKYRIGMTAGQEKRIDRATDVQSALS